MKEMKFKYLLVGHIFILNNCVHTKINHGRAINETNGSVLNIKKSKLVITNEKYFENENI